MNACDVYFQTQCMVLNRQAFTELLGPLREVLDRNLGIRVIQSVPMLKKLSPDDANKVLSMFQSVSFSAGQALLSVGQAYSTFFVVKSGTVRISKGSETGSRSCSAMGLQGYHASLFCCAAFTEDMGAGGYFGELALTTDVVSDCTVVAADVVECFVLDRRRIESDIGVLSVRGFPLLFINPGAASRLLSP